MELAVENGKQGEHVEHGSPTDHDHEMDRWILDSGVTDG